MTAEEIYNKWNQSADISVSHKAVAIQAMKDYARLMIEQDRERVKYAVNYPYKDEYGCTCNVPGVVDMTPIILT